MNPLLKRGGRGSFKLFKLPNAPLPKNISFKKQFYPKLYSHEYIIDYNLLIYMHIYN